MVLSLNRGDPNIEYPSILGNNQIFPSAKGQRRSLPGQDHPEDAEAFWFESLIGLNYYYCY